MIRSDIYNKETGIYDLNGLKSEIINRMNLIIEDHSSDTIKCEYNISLQDLYLTDKNDCVFDARYHNLEKTIIDFCKERNIDLKIKRKKESILIEIDIFKPFEVSWT